MGLQSELEDITYDSIPILLLTIIAAALRNLRAAVFTFLHRISQVGLYELVHSVQTSFILLAEQLNLNITSNSDNEFKRSDDDCVVCLCEMRKGQRLQRLDCKHVFHQKCLDGWLKQLHFTCPLCRSPVPPPTSLISHSNLETSFDLVSWFGFR